MAIRIMSHHGVRDPDVIAAALLQDTVEDHAAELAPDGTTAAALDALAARFGPRVAELVGLVTNPEYDPGRDKHEQYREHVTASLDASPWARIIKTSDFADNGIGLIRTTGPRIACLASKYAPLLPALRETIGRPDTPLGESARQRILEQLGQAKECSTPSWHQAKPDPAGRAGHRNHPQHPYWPPPHFRTVKPAFAATAGNVAAPSPRA